MEVVRPFEELAQRVPVAELGRAAYVARGLARAAALQLHNQTLTRIVFPEMPEGPSVEEQRELRRRIIELYRNDYDAAVNGFYPSALLNDFSWAHFAAVYPRLMLDAPKVRRRVRDNDYNELPRRARHFPRYYQRTFHFQTDGYLSESSAELYDTQVQLLFGGTADAMRRQVLPPLVHALRGREPAKTRVLDVACGTGGLLRMIATALPEVQLFGLDLSPQYVAHARRTLEHIAPLSLVVENAESLPFRDGYFDAITNVFLFHELPPQARDAVLSEIFRVLAPGGLFVFADSVQLVDAPRLRHQLEAFPQQFHEPFYRQYVRDDLRTRFIHAGFEIEGVRQAFLTKVVVARKPARRAM